MHIINSVLKNNQEKPLAQLTPLEREEFLRPQINLTLNRAPSIAKTWQPNFSKEIYNGKVCCYGYLIDDASVERISKMIHYRENPWQAKWGLPILEDLLNSTQRGIIQIEVQMSLLQTGDQNDLHRQKTKRNLLQIEGQWGLLCMEGQKGDSQKYKWIYLQIVEPRIFYGYKIKMDILNIEGQEDLPCRILLWIEN